MIRLTSFSNVVAKSDIIVVVVTFAGVLDVTMVAAAIGFAWLLMKAVSIVGICLAAVNSSEVVLDAMI